MRPELRFVLAIFLMIGVLFGTNLLFPPPPTPEPPTPAAVEGEPQTEEPPESAVTTSVGIGVVPAPDAPVVPERRIRVRGPLYEFEFSNYGAQLQSASCRDSGRSRTTVPVQLLLRNGPGALGSRVAVAGDTPRLLRGAVRSVSRGRTCAGRGRRPAGA